VIHHEGTLFSVNKGPLDRAALRCAGPWQQGDRARALPDGQLAVFAGLGRPIDALGDLADRPGTALWPLPDHAAVDAALADRLRRWAGDRPLVCTPKDRVRLPADLAAEVWWRDAWIAIDDPPARWLP
jgi:tetraacyldisaccharide-1-P 4'-kinase